MIHYDATISALGTADYVAAAVLVVLVIGTLFAIAAGHR